jgi:ubiquitin-like-conjugating enzyme ATG3
VEWFNTFGIVATPNSDQSKNAAQHQPKTAGISLLQTTVMSTDPAAADPAAGITAPPVVKNATTTMGYFWKAREMLTPTLKQSAFLSKGVLTPEEFVLAGDELVFRCPTWSWQGGGDSVVSYLPKDKQYLITRNVPCQNRVATLELQLPTHMMVADGDGGDDDDWMISSLLPVGGGGKNANDDEMGTIEDDFDVLDQDGEVVVPTMTTSATNKSKKNADTAVEEEEDEYTDMADFEDDNVLADDDAIVKMVDENEQDDDHIVKVRTYDLSITYDKYYQTPRIWMTGKSAAGHPLTARETMEDVMTDYANKTVTMEAHPFLPGPHASIHPCKHGKVMKAIVRNLMASAKAGAAEPTVEMYIFIFLKFVSSIIPTISYDFTMNVSASTAK